MLRLDNNYHDHALGSQYCPDCLELVGTQHEALKDHLKAVWRHYHFVTFHQILKTDEVGKTLEGQIEYPARTILVQNPRQTSLFYCLDCSPFDKTEGCSRCGQPVDIAKEHSEVETLECLVSGINQTLRHWMFHIDCLPDQFVEAKQSTNKV